MKTFIITALLMTLCAVAFAGVPYINQNVHADGALGSSPDPFQTVLISDNYSHTVTLTNQIWYDLSFRGSGTCIIRLMGTTTKATWPAEPVANGSASSYLFNSKVKFFNYSGCNSGTAPQNSILHLM